MYQNLILLLVWALLYTATDLSSSSKCTKSINATFHPAFEKTLTSQTPWTTWAINVLWQQLLRDGITPLMSRTIPSFDSKIRVYFKNEGNSVTSSLKHRIAWALFMWALVEGKIQRNTRVIEASSGNTATSEAFFARLLRLEYTVVVHETSSKYKVKEVERYGGHVVKTTKSITDVAKGLADKCGSDCFFMNQFAHCQAAVDYESNSKYGAMNLFEEIMSQVTHEHAEKEEPVWFVNGVGTGGTITSVGKYVMKNQLKTKMAVVDPYKSVVHDYLVNHDPSICIPRETPFPSIEGIGSYGPLYYGKTISLLAPVISKAIKVPDPFSAAAMHLLAEILDYPVGISTGANFYGVLQLAWQMDHNHQNGSIATLICDRGRPRYSDTYWNKTWLATAFATKVHKDGNYYVDCAYRILEQYWYHKKGTLKPLVSLGDCHYAHDVLHG